MMDKDKIIAIILNAHNIVFLTGAGVSTLSGIPDYRSMSGVYANKENPEYLLSHTCLMKEPQKFYDFIQELYHPEAKPNIIHQAMAKLDETKNVTVITQNIDQLHHLANSKHILEFHGNLYDLYCLNCHKKISLEEYSKGFIHQEDGGLIRPNVVLYEEGLNSEVVAKSIRALKEADVIALVGTSFQVYPFASLLDYTSNEAIVVLINNDDVYNNRIDYKYLGDAKEIFSNI